MGSNTWLISLHHTAACKAHAAACTLLVQPALALASSARIRTGCATRTANDTKSRSEQVKVSLAEGAKDADEGAGDADDTSARIFLVVGVGDGMGDEVGDGVVGAAGESLITSAVRFREYTPSQTSIFARFSSER